MKVKKTDQKCPLCGQQMAQPTAQDAQARAEQLVFVNWADVDAAVRDFTELPSEKALVKIILLSVMNIAVGLTISDENKRWTPQQASDVCTMVVRTVSVGLRAIRRASKAVKEGCHASQVN